MVQSIAAAQAANPDARKKALALIPGTVDVDALFDWAEYKFPELFPAAGGMRFNLAYQGVNYRLRYYSTGNYLGLTDNDAIWGLGPFTDNQLMKIGMLSDYAQLVVDDQCKVYPGSSGCSTGITGPLNECAHPSTDALPTGLRSHLVYQYSGTLTGEQTLDTVIDGPGYDFQGKSRIRISTTSSGTTTVEGFPVTTTNNIKTFHIIQDGVARTLGSLVDLDTVTIGIAGAPALGTITSSLTVFEPPRDNWEFRLALGETATVATTTVTTQISPPGPTLTSTLAETVTFESKESVTVPAGTFEACRYRIGGSSDTSYRLTWYILGKGVPAKIQSIANGQTTDTQELKAGSTFGGAPI